MLSSIRRAPSAQPAAKNVCIFCQRQPLTTLRNIGLNTRFTSTVLSSTASRIGRTSSNPKVKQILLRDASTMSTKAGASAELIKEIRTEVEAHRQGLQKKKSKEGEKKSSEFKKKSMEGEKKNKDTAPKAPKVCKKTKTMPVGIPFSHTGKTLAQALRADRTVLTLNPSDAELTPIEVPGQPEVPSLSHDLDRVLFNPGVYFLQDPRSKVYNFDPYLQKIMPVHEFQFEALSQYITSSRDSRLETKAKDLGKKYVGSTSSMTSILSHFHYLLSNWRPINPAVVSKQFFAPWRTFTALQRAPQSIFLRWKDGVYAIDSDKEFDKESVLTLLGKSMEKLLTLPPENFEKYRRSQNLVDLEVEEQKRAVDTYHYSTLGDFLMRSQLDAYDARLPGTGMFDLKTRAVVAIRMDVDNFHIGSGYQIKDRFGEWESFEREYFDMIRAAFLKYSLQVRMGRMDGIFVAFHNTERIFGFQYISLEEMDAALHQDWHSGIGDREFKLSLQLLNDVFNRAVEKFPERSLRIHFETRETQTPLMYIFAEPMEEREIDEIQDVRNGDLSIMLKELADRKEQYVRSLSEKEAELEAKLEADERFTEVEAEVEAEEETAEDEEVPVSTSADEAPDDVWAEQMAKELDANTNKEILAYTLKIKSFINGKVVLRPDHLKPNDSWEVQYELEEIKGSRAWSTYRACYSRRAQLERAHDDMTGGIIAGSSPNGNGKSNEFRNVYIETIRGISQKGREYITEVEKEQTEKIVWKGKA
ncbi:Pet127-domain-containing protein [Terfezia boudieri ATCC MYA-4762]|uniref:Pet127-domain-containing protein n=1 Tax=Terfezia boudieri ATCC MYA-4762 TaxID=1051890 RepID=A0A3N4LR30_9PEZI|nr:Pet127-domain-containing protein [Terfezia boudieri ATCC MYA-4762]